MAQDVVRAHVGRLQIESRGGDENIFAVARRKTAVEGIRGRGFREEGRSGDDVSGSSERREGARHEGRQGEHDAGKPDQH